MPEHSPSSLPKWVTEDVGKKRQFFKRNDKGEIISKRVRSNEKSIQDNPSLNQQQIDLIPSGAIETSEDLIATLFQTNEVPNEETLPLENQTSNSNQSDYQLTNQQQIHLIASGVIETSENLIATLFQTNKVPNEETLPLENRTSMIIPNPIYMQPHDKDGNNTKPNLFESLFKKQKVNTVDLDNTEKPTSSKPS